MRAPLRGARWFNGLERAVLSLDQHPRRFPVAPESVDADHPVRVLTYGRKPHTYRSFFTVDDETVLCASCMCGVVQGNGRFLKRRTEGRLACLPETESRQPEECRALDIMAQAEMALSPSTRIGAYEVLAK